MNSVQEAQRLGQAVWYDNIRRGMLASGEMRRLVELGVSGLTSNPTIFEKAIAGSADYDDSLMAASREGKSPKAMFERLALDDIQAAADLLRPAYDGTGGSDGYASLEVNPNLAYDTDGTIAEAQRLFEAVDRPNVMIKVPATPEGIPAVRSLIGRGINVNITLIFSLEAHRQVMEAYVEGLEALSRAGGDLSRVASVASFFVSRVDAAVDAALQERIEGGRRDLEDLLGRTAIANAKLAYRGFEEAFGSERFAKLRAEGAQLQKPLWASTGVKNPDYSDVLYVESLIGPNTVNTMPPQTLTAFLEHGRVEDTVAGGAAEAERVMERLSEAGIDIDEVTDKLLSDGVRAFAASFEKLLTNIEEKTAQLMQHRAAVYGGGLGELEADVDAVLVDLERQEVGVRVWRRDHTVWDPEPRDIADRLGWLTVTDSMREQAPALEDFAKGVRDEDIGHVVLLGMGGSSLGPEVLRRTFGSADGWPEMIVLDSTAPAWVRAVSGAIDPARTLFIVSSKSGGTIEPNVLYRHFRAAVEEAVGNDRPGRRFAAITDQGTVLEDLALRHGFREIFRNPPDIGGRYSVLSYFGLVPAALMGIDVVKLLDRADSMREAAAPHVPARDNPGIRLGATIGALALKGKDKLTLTASPSIASFSLWVEQLLAESTGKDGTGIVPVAGEPFLDPGSYGSDRLFVYTRVAGDDNDAVDAHMERVAASGQPVVRLDLRDRYDLAVEFFRWEFVTAIAGTVLGVHPFDQPNVQQAKDLTRAILREYEESGRIDEPWTESTEMTRSSLRQLLAAARQGDYLAIMAYAQPTPETEAALADVRRRVADRYRIATTLGYGPRFLHSTGQLHKGGPPAGLFLQVTTPHDPDLGIPGESYSYGTLIDAQALGDLRALRELERRVVSVRTADIASWALGLWDER